MPSRGDGYFTSKTFCGIWHRIAACARIGIRPELFHDRLWRDGSGSWLSSQNNNDQCDDCGDCVHGQILQMRISGTSGDGQNRLHVKHIRSLPMSMRPSIPVAVRSSVMLIPLSYAPILALFDASLASCSPARKATSWGLLDSKCRQNVTLARLEAEPCLDCFLSHDLV